MNSNEKFYLIVGGTSGIGLATTKLLIESGHRVMIVGRSEDKLDNAIKYIDSPNLLVQSFDVCNTSEILPFVEHIVTNNGKLSGLIYAAGYEETLPLGRMKPDSVERIHKTNLFGAIEFTRVCAKKKHYNNGFSVVFLSSVMGQLGEPGKISYCSTKAALQGAAKAMAVELAPKGIRVNTVSPGVVETPMSQKLFEALDENAIARIKSKHPLGLGTPEDIANAIDFLISDKSRWITGSNLVIDGGYSIQ